MQAREGELFRLEAGPFRGGDLRVESFRGREAVSRPYRWDISVDAPSEPPDVIETALLAQPARLDISLQGDAPRTVHGVAPVLQERHRSRPEDAESWRGSAELRDRSRPQGLRLSGKRIFLTAEELL